MSRLQQRRQSHRRRMEAISNLYKAGSIAAAIVLLWFIWQLPSTRAYFTDREETQSSFRATTFADNLSLCPGSSKTNDSPGDPGPAFRVAQAVYGQIYLDFGTYPAGNNSNFPHVLTVKNIADRTLSLRWHFSANMAQHFEIQDEDIILDPNEVYELGFKLDTSPQDQAGEFFGTLHLSALNGFITAELPARLRLAAKKGGKGQQASVSTSVYHDPGTGVSEAVYQGPDDNGNGNDGNSDDNGNDYDNGNDDSNKSGKGKKQFIVGWHDTGGAVSEPPGVTESVYQSPEYNGKNNHKGGQASEKAAGQDNSDNGDTPSGKESDN